MYTVCSTVQYSYSSQIHTSVIIGFFRLVLDCFTIVTNEHLEKGLSSASLLKLDWQDRGIPNGKKPNI